MRRSFAKKLSCFDTSWGFTTQNIFQNYIERSFEISISSPRSQAVNGRLTSTSFPIFLMYCSLGEVRALFVFNTSMTSIELFISLVNIILHCMATEGFFYHPEIKSNCFDQYNQTLQKARSTKPSVTQRKKINDLAQRSVKMLPT